MDLNWTCSKTQKQPGQKGDEIRYAIDHVLPESCEDLVYGTTKLRGKLTKHYNIFYSKLYHMSHINKDIKNEKGFLLCFVTWKRRKT